MADSITEQGFASSIKGEELWVDFGDVTPKLSFLALTFHDDKEAWSFYGKIVKITVEIVGKP